MPEKMAEKRADEGFSFVHSRARLALKIAYFYRNIKLCSVYLTLLRFKTIA